MRRIKQSKIDCVHDCAQTDVYVYLEETWVNFYQRAKPKALKITEDQMFHLSPVILLDKKLLGSSAQQAENLRRVEFRSGI